VNAQLDDTVPKQLSSGRWTFTQGDARENLVLR
jgi:hypothetical protein